MRDVAQQPRDGDAVGSQLVGHGVEVPGEHRQFVLAALETGAHAHLQVLAGQRARARLYAPDRCAQMLRQPPAGEAR